MKDKRVIKIKDPRLRKIRNEFRNLWSSAETVRWRGFGDEMEEIRFDKNDDHRILIEERSPENLKYYRSLQEAQQDLRENFRRSICMCYTCGRADLDMYYNKAYNAWWCVECVGMFRVMHPQMKEKYADKDPRFYDFDEGFGESFL